MSAVHDDEVFTSLTDESHIVRDIDHGAAVFLFEAIDEFDDAVFDGDIESGGGFVEDEELRLIGYFYSFGEELAEFDTLRFTT